MLINKDIKQITVTVVRSEIIELQTAGTIFQTIYLIYCLVTISRKTDDRVNHFCTGNAVPSDCNNSIIALLFNYSLDFRVLDENRS